MTEERKALTELTKEEALQYLTKAAEIVEEQMKLEKEVPYMFCGLEDKRRIFIFSDELFLHLVELFQPVARFNVDEEFGKDNENTKCEFEMELLGKTYTVFCLLDRTPEVTANVE